MSFNKSGEQSINFLLYFGFFLIGGATVLIGQILPLVSARLSLSDSEAGNLFVAQFSGSLLGTLLANRLVKRFGFPFVLSIGFSLSALGTWAINSNSLLACLGAFFILGGGIGLTIPTVNLYTVEINREKTSSALNVVNFFWGFGAILCKPFVDFLGGKDIFLPTSILAGLLVSVGLAINFRAVRKLENTESGEKSDENCVPIWTTWTAWTIAAFNFLQIGLESGMGGWITTYAARVQSSGNSTEWISAASVFFLFLVAGRGAAPLFLRFLSDDVMLSGSLSIVLFGTIVLLATNNFILTIFGAAIFGAGCSSIFPINMSRFIKTFGETAARRATPLFIAGTFGGAATTYLIGFISTTFNNLRFGMCVLPACCLTLIILQIFLSKKKY